MKLYPILAVIAIMTSLSCTEGTKKPSINTEKPGKPVVYQLMVRLFGNKNSTNKLNGSIEENGSGKFNDISDKALEELKKLGVTHVWYTGVIEHATMTDYSRFGIKQDDPDIVKGRAGSPYAIKDYYDVDPDLAVDVKGRMKEFEQLVERTHKNGLAVIIDFVPNHVARTYGSDAKPGGVKDFGEDDDRSVAYSPKNDFYYIPGKNFIVPEGTNAGGDGFASPMKDNRFAENPAKATGNNVFSEKPSINDWSETVKLNYGVEYQADNKTVNHFEPVPAVWKKMKDILSFWAKKGVDGFRCDVAEMVPVEFWSWVIPEIKKINPKLVFIAEAYDPKMYETYLTKGKFDYLYDKVGTYDALKRLIKDQPEGKSSDLSALAKEQTAFSHKMLRFLENHDEERIASKGFAGDARLAIPAMVISATMSGGPVLVYFGQEVGESGSGIEGFGGEDNRTSIFDYWGVPEHQKWMNGGKFDGGGLSAEQKNLRAFYTHLLNFSKSNEAITKGKFYDLAVSNKLGNKQYAYLRYTDTERVLVLANFDRKQIWDANVQFPQDSGVKMPAGFKDELAGKTIDASKLEVPASGVLLLTF